MVFDTAQREFPLKSRIFAALSGQQDLAISPRSGALDSPDEVWPSTTHTNFDASKASTLSEPICLSQLSIQSAVRQLIPLNPLQIWITRAAGTSPPSQGCAAQSSAEPDKYLKVQPPAASPPPPAAAVPHTEYICAMHPEVHKSGPGSCPKCGMALEPASMAAPLTAIQYTCPMHPEIVRTEPESRKLSCELPPASRRRANIPLGAAIPAAARERRVGPSAVEAFQSLTGKGVSGTLNGMKAAIGKQRPDERFRSAG